MTARGRGNQAADLAARGEALRLRVEAGQRERRGAALPALKVVHDVFAAVEVAAMAAARGGPARARRRRYPRDGQFVRLLGGAR